MAAGPGGASVGTGASIVFGTSSFSALITKIGLNSQKRKAIPTSHLASTSETFIPGALVDAGELVLDLLFDPDKVPPITGVAETITITFNRNGATTGAKVVGTGFIIDVSDEAPLEAVMTAKVTIKWSGALAWTASVA